MIKVKLQILLLFTLVGFNLSAQEYLDLIKLDIATGTLSQFDTLNIETRLIETNADVTVPIVVNERFTILTGLTYEGTQGNFNPLRKTETLTGLTLKLGVNITHSEKWSGTYLVLPKLSSDLKVVNEKDAQFGAVALLKYAISSHLNYKFGVYANSELFGPFVVPMFGVYYLSPNDKIEAKILLPLAADLNYSFQKNMRVGLNFKGQIRSYNSNTPFQNETDRYITRSTNDLYSYFQYAIKNGINFQVGLGRSLGRSYRAYNEKVGFGLPLVYLNDKRAQLNHDFSDSWLLKLSMFYRIALDK
jgi:hypothetical protein